MTYEEPIVEVVAAERVDSVARLRLAIVHRNDWPSLPLMPASLWAIDDPSEAVFDLHQLVEQTVDTLAYETYEHAAQLPPVGTQCVFRVWWAPWQLEAVVDRDRIWTLRQYPDNGSHDHCVLTWEMIAADEGHREGYESEGEWMTIEAYQTYIVRDLLRLRRTASI